MDKETYFKGFYEGDNITVTCDFIDYRDELLEENQRLKADYGNKAQIERDILLEEKQKLIDYLKEEIKDGRPQKNDKYGNPLLWHMGYFDVCKEILSKIEKRKI